MRFIKQKTVRVHGVPGDNMAIVFLHIPKTAGTTLRYILQREYAPQTIYRVQKRVPGWTIEDFRALPPDTLDRIRVVNGHFDFGFHEYLPRPCTYIAILRNPVDRIISHYYYVKRDRDHYLYKEIHGRGMTLDDYVRSGLTPELDNAQVKQVSGDYVGHGQCTDVQLKRAIANIENHFSVIGLSERFDETLLLIQRRFGWSDPLYVRENVTANRPQRGEVGEQTRTVIEELNSYDMKLYEYVSRRMDRQIAEYGADFGPDLERFRRLNAVHGTLRLAARRVLIGLRRMTGALEPAVSGDGPPPR